MARRAYVWVADPDGPHTLKGLLVSQRLDGLLKVFRLRLCSMAPAWSLSPPARMGDCRLVDLDEALGVDRSLDATPIPPCAPSRLD